MIGQETAAEITLHAEGSKIHPRAALRRIAPKLAAGAAGLLFSRALLPGGYAPLGAAFLAAVPQGGLTAALAGGILGSLNGGGSLTMEGLRRVSVLLGVGGIRWALGQLRRVNTAKYYPFFTALAGVLLTNGVISGTLGLLLDLRMLFFVAEGLMAGAAAMLLRDGWGAAEALGSRLLGGNGRVYTVSLPGAASLLVLLAALSVPLCRVRVLSLSPVAVLLHATVLSVLPKERETGGAVGGITVGAVRVLSGGGILQGAALPMAALLAGYAARYGRIVASSVYTGVCFAVSVMTGQMQLPFLLEVALGGATACLLPTEPTERMLAAAGLARRVKEVCTPGHHSGVAQRLRSASAALTGASAVAEKVSEGLERLHAPDAADGCLRAFERVCGNCASKETCPHRRDGKTGALAARLAAGLEANGSVSGTSLTAVLGHACAREDALLGELNRQFGYYLASVNSDRRLSDVRTVAHQQMRGVGQMLDELSEEIDAGDYTDCETAGQLAARLTGCGLAVKQVICEVSRSGRRSVTLTLRSSGCTAAEQAKAASLAEECLGVPLESSETAACGRNEWRLCLRQREKYRLTVGAAQHCHAGERFCGDAWERFEDGDGFAYALISDGMGSGGSAAVDSALTCGLFSRLLQGGFRVDGAVRLVNAALMMKAESESLATLDCLRVNLYNGRCRFWKAGAVQSYCVRNGEVRRVEADSLPLGILTASEVSRRTLTAEAGDLFVLISDGVPDDGSGWFEQMLTACAAEERSPQETAACLLEQSERRRAEGEDDDITVLAIRVESV